MSHEIEILGPSIQSKSEAQQLIRVAIKHFKVAKRATIQTMADLRSLQNGEVHVLYGYSNFAKWAEDTFEGLSAGNVRQLCRAGAVVLELQDRNLIDSENPEGVGTTGLRELSVIAGTYGQDKMVEVFNTAREMAKEREVSATTVEAALKVLMPPAVEVLPEPEDLTEFEDHDDSEPDTEHSAKVQELMDRVRDLSWELPESATDIEDVLRQLKAELSGESTDVDQTWIEGTR